MTGNQYSEVLKTASDALSTITSNVRLIGDGAGRFLVASQENLGIEFYAAGNEFVVDPAINGELQGEHIFGTVEEALKYASEWLANRLKNQS